MIPIVILHCMKIDMYVYLDCSPKAKAHNLHWLIALLMFWRSKLDMVRYTYPSGMSCLFNVFFFCIGCICAVKTFIRQISRFCLQNGNTMTQYMYVLFKKLYCKLWLYTPLLEECSNSEEYERLWCICMFCKYIKIYSYVLLVTYICRQHDWLWKGYLVCIPR